MALTGNMAKLPKLSRLLRGLSGVPSRAAGPLAERISERVRDTYANECDPYEVPWAALKDSTVRRKHGNSVILTRTGASQADCGARPMSGSGIAVYAGGAAVWHMQASGTRPARPVLPTHGLPPAWREDIAAVLGAAYATALGRSSR